MGKGPRIKTTKKVNKSSTNEATVFTIKTNTPTIKPPKKPPDPRCNNHAGGQRVAKGVALAQRVPGQEKHDKQKDSARFQRVPGLKLSGRDQNDPREGVLDTLQVSMHPYVGPDTDGSRTIMVPVVGY